MLKAVFKLCHSALLDFIRVFVGERICIDVSRTRFLLTKFKAWWILRNRLWRAVKT